VMKYTKILHFAQSATNLSKDLNCDRINNKIDMIRKIIITMATVGAALSGGVVFKNCRSLSKFQRECVNCNDGYFDLFEYKCKVPDETQKIANCDGYQSTDNGEVVCDTCIKGYYLSKTSKECTKCIVDNCAACTPKSGTCAACVKDMTPSEDGTLCLPMRLEEKEENCEMKFKYKLKMDEYEGYRWHFFLGTEDGKYFNFCAECSDPYVMVTSGDIFKGDYNAECKKGVDHCSMADSKTLGKECILCQKGYTMTSKRQCINENERQGALKENNFKNTDIGEKSNKQPSPNTEDNQNLLPPKKDKMNTDGNSLTSETSFFQVFKELPEEPKMRNFENLAKMTQKRILI
jgi:hypothetical protein